VDDFTLTDEPCRILDINYKCVQNSGQESRRKQIVWMNLQDNAEIKPKDVVCQAAGSNSSEYQIIAGLL
jgi:hypothetical protein